jgi:hypothetical protein
LGIERGWRKLGEFGGRGDVAHVSEAQKRWRPQVEEYKTEILGIG